MNHLKTYEAFFNAFSDKPISDELLVKLIGVDLETIKDLLIDIEDKLPHVHISISFYYVGNSVFTFKLEERDLKFKGPLVFNSYGVRIKEIEMRVDFFPKKSFLEDIRKKANRDELTSQYKLMLNGQDISDDLKTFAKRLVFYKFKKVDIIPSNQLLTIRQLINSNIYHVDQKLPQGEAVYGSSFLEITARKEVITR